MSTEAPATMGPRAAPNPGAPEAPALSREAMRRELSALHQGQHRTLRSAIFARLAEASDDGATLEVPVRGEARAFRVVAVTGELALRREIARETTEATVYLVPFARSLPRDIEAVLAGGRLWLPQVEWLLPRRFGARGGTRRLLASRLRVVAQREGTRVYAQGEAASIDLDDAWMLFLRDRLGPGVGALTTEAQLLAATLLDREKRGEALSALLNGVPESRQEVAEVLERRLGSSAPLILAAWLGEQGVELCAMAVAGEATREVLREGKGTGFALLGTVIEMRVLQTPGHPLRPVRDEGGVGSLARALIDLGYLVPMVWTALAANEPLRRAILGEAEKILGTEHVRPLALGSDRLPFAFTQRGEAFLAAVAVAASASDRAAVGRALSAIDGSAAQLLAHDRAREDERLAELVEMASRLAAFLAEPEPRGEGPHAEIIALAAFQAAVGGHVDWARQVVRADVGSPLGKGLLPLVRRVDGVRDALDGRFARAYEKLVGPTGERGVLRGAALVDGLRAEVLLVEDALGTLALGLLEERRDLKLLVLCMDGMSHANLAELWSFSAQRSFVPVSRGRRSPVLAHIPTITRLSRGALFAGRALRAGESLDTGRDGERLAQHAGVKRLGESPKVLLRREILGTGGGLSDDAAQVVRGEARIVAVVVNAIDDQLKGSAQLRVTLSTENIRPLSALLDAAESTGRLVLLVSDHGNISSQRFLGAEVRAAGPAAPGAEHGARHRSLRAGEAAMADEIELPAGALGTGRVAAAVSEALRYTSLLHAGEHGGAGLAEAIAPAVLLAPEGMLGELSALGVERWPLDPPSFWSRDRGAWDPLPSGRGSSLSLEPRGEPRPAGSGSPAPAAVGQVTLPFEAAADNGIAAAVFKSALFKSQLREIPESERSQAQKGIELLVRHGGRMSRDRFAVGLGIDTAGKGVRVPGFLTRIERVLNLDGEVVVAMDRKGQTIELDLPRLRALFLEDDDG